MRKLAAVFSVFIGCFAAVVLTVVLTSTIRGGQHDDQQRLEILWDEHLSAVRRENTLIERCKAERDASLRADPRCRTLPGGRIWCLCPGGDCPSFPGDCIDDVRAKETP